MKHRVFMTAGFLGCLLALFLTMGGHWVVLQSVAWARMLRDYSRAGSLSEAIDKTFDGKHPCKLCLKIRKGRQEEQSRAPIVVLQKQPELWLDTRGVTIPHPPAERGLDTVFIPDLHADFKPAPPKPPPRAG